jgi:hypothetical protein
MQARIKEISDRVGDIKNIDWSSTPILNHYSAEFIANAPSDINYLLDALQESREENKSTRERNVIFLNKLKELSKQVIKSQDRERVLREALEEIKEMSEVELLESSWSVCNIALR